MFWYGVVLGVFVKLFGEVFFVMDNVLVSDIGCLFLGVFCFVCSLNYEVVVVFYVGVVILLFCGLLW